MISHIIREKANRHFAVNFAFYYPFMYLAVSYIYYPSMQCFSSFYPFVIQILFMKLIVENSKVSWFRPH